MKDIRGCESSTRRCQDLHTSAPKSDMFPFYISPCSDVRMQLDIINASDSGPGRPFFQREYQQFPPSTNSQSCIVFRAGVPDGA